MCKITHKTDEMTQKTDHSMTTVEKWCVTENENDQRIDNFLFRHCKSVPKSHIYQLLRSGQIRINGKRISANYRLQLDDMVRIPPIRIAPIDSRPTRSVATSNFVAFKTLFEDDALLVLDKPAGMAVHGGSGISHGVIEQLRAQNHSWKFLELVHRLDRETSGVLLLAKKRSALTELHRQIREGLTEKHYWAMVQGQWRHPRQHVKLALTKYVTAAGERRVAIAKNDHDALKSHTIFKLHTAWKNFSLLDAELKTGRTHQIRVHLAHLGFPILGDDKYGDFETNRKLAKAGPQAHLARMFLHAHTLLITHPITQTRMTLQSPLPKDLQKFIDALSIPSNN